MNRCRGRLSGSDVAHRFEETLAEFHKLEHKQSGATLSLQTSELFFQRESDCCLQLLIVLQVGESAWNTEEPRSRNLPARIRGPIDPTARRDAFLAFHLKSAFKRSEECLDSGYDH